MVPNEALGCCPGLFRRDEPEAVERGSPRDVHRVAEMVLPRCVPIESGPQKREDPVKEEGILLGDHNGQPFAD
jgi:hypothetical protein